MQRLRETLAHGGVAVLAVTFALASATIAFANAVATEIVSVLYQATYGLESGSGFEFAVWGTDVGYSFILQSTIVLAPVAGLFFAATAPRSCRRAQGRCTTGSAS
jgi:hypothetical protein